MLDGLGIGPAHDTAAYGDQGSDTLGNVLRAAHGIELPNLSRLGLGNCAPLDGMPPVERPSAAWGTARHDSVRLLVAEVLHNHPRIAFG